MYGSTNTDMDLEGFIRNYSHLLSGGYGVRYAMDDSGEAPEAAGLASLEAFSAWTGDYAEEDVHALLRLADGRYATVSASCDSTGYDCRGYVDWRYSESFEDAVMFGLTENGRELLFPEENTADES